MNAAPLSSTAHAHIGGYYRGNRADNDRPESIEGDRRRLDAVASEQASSFEHSRNSDSNDGCNYELCCGLLTSCMEMHSSFAHTERQFAVRMIELHDDQ